MREGSKVSYVGDPYDGIDIGDEGKVLTSEASSARSNVIWRTGKRAGEVTLVSDEDLVATSKASSVAESIDLSLETAGLVTVAVRDTYDRAGAPGLINALNEAGHLSIFASIAEAALQHVSDAIKQDPMISEVLSDLDPDEGDEFVNLASSVLLRDAFGGE
jgi:hypothetical protein